MTHAKVREFEAVGVTENEERMYRVLLEHAGSTLAQLSRNLGLSSHKARVVLDALETKGLATHSPERLRRYLPVPPDVALESLIQKRSDDLTRVRAAASELQEQVSVATGRRTSQERVLEIISSRERVPQVFAQVQRAAQYECICLDKPPYIVGPPDTVDSNVIEGLRRGISYRCIMDLEAFEYPGVIDRVRTSMEAGENVRVASNLPLKLFFADDRMGLLPLSLQELDGPVLLLRSSALLDALRAFFELLWDRATPIAFTRTGDLKMDGTAVRFPIDLDELVPRLAAGANDKTIAHELGLSTRTFDRRIDEFMKSLNARTRFQAGWLAALRMHPPGTGRERESKGAHKKST
jgi:sugar-specific transcriptional regulator TrmB